MTLPRRVASWLGLAESPETKAKWDALLNDCRNGFREETTVTREDFSENGALVHFEMRHEERRRG